MTRGEYGPQDAAADRFLSVLDRLDTPDVVALGAAGGGVVGTEVIDPQVVARAELRRALREIARRAGRLDAVRAIGGEVESWAGSARHWFPAGVAGTLESTTSMGPRMAALPVVLDAAYGVVLADQLREAELAILLGPWRDLAGDPFEPGSPYAARDVGDQDDRAAGGAGWSRDTGTADGEASTDEPGAGDEA